MCTLNIHTSIQHFEKARVKSTKFNTFFEKCGVYSFFKFIENLCTLKVHD